MIINIKNKVYQIFSKIHKIIKLRLDKKVIYFLRFWKKLEKLKKKIPNIIKNRNIFFWKKEMVAILLIYQISNYIIRFKINKLLIFKYIYIFFKKKLEIL